MIQRSCVADIGEMAEQFDRRDQLGARFKSALQTECEHRAALAAEIFLRQRVIVAVRQPSIGNPADLVAAFEPLRHRQSIVTMTLHPQRKRFHTGQNLEGVKRCQGRPQIAQRQGARRQDKGQIAKSIVKTLP